MRNRLVVALAAVTLAFGASAAEAAPKAAKAPPKAAAKAAAKPAAKPAPKPAAPPVAEAPVSEAAVQMAEWVVASGDNRGLAFVIIDKVHAQLFVYGPDGELKGQTPALLGLARGDDSFPGVGDKKLSEILPEEKTTPAGRFLAAYGPAPGGRKVIWVDYESAVSLHPVVTNNPKEQRLKRLKSPEADDNRITYGCINVPASFYQKVVRPAFKNAEAIVYVLPELRPVEDVFPAVTLQARSGGAAASDVALVD